MGGADPYCMVSLSQAIVGSQLSLTGVTDFRGFGAALVSGIDVDGNTYNGEHVIELWKEK